MSKYTTTITPEQLNQTKTSLEQLSKDITTLQSNVSKWLTEITNSWDDAKVRKLQEDYKETYQKALIGQKGLQGQLDNFKDHVVSVQKIYQTLSDNDY
jgi:uncharacterized protein (DUF3084 family)